MFFERSGLPAFARKTRDMVYHGMGEELGDREPRVCFPATKVGRMKRLVLSHTGRALSTLQSTIQFIRLILL